MAEFFGDIERALADLYVYRWPISFGILLLVTGVTVWGYRKGWHMVIWKHRLAVSIVGTPALAALLIAGWYFGSPLFTSKTVNEEFPFAFNAVVPSNMTRTTVEQTMAGMCRPSAMMEDNIKESDDSTIMEAKAMVEEAIEVSDEAMITKGLDMMAESMEAMAEVPAAQVGPVKLKSGNFQDADSFHRGSGQATIYRGPDGSHLRRLENLSVTNGPDLHVILSPHQNPGSRGDVKQQGYVDLGKLKGNKGNQNYTIPNGVDVDTQMSVVIYCVPFSVIFSVAMLQAQG